MTAVAMCGAKFETVPCEGDPNDGHRYHHGHDLSGHLVKWSTPDDDDWSNVIDVEEPE